MSDGLHLEGGGWHEAARHGRGDGPAPISARLPLFAARYRTPLGEVVAFAPCPLAACASAMENAAQAASAGIGGLGGGDVAGRGTRALSERNGGDGSSGGGARQLTPPGTPTTSR